jgi:tRNA pseudouridine55 synthase
MEKEENNIYKSGMVLLLDKPRHWTSFAVVKKVNYLLKGIKVGHAGTLDPLATGLLILCTGKFTKRINEFMAQEKEYTGSFTLGASTATYDLEAEPEQSKDISWLKHEMIRDATKQFSGEILQVPPAHSAIKKDGQRAYQMARRGETVTLAPRKIKISEFEIVNIELPMVYFRVVCSTGTYIRSLAHDFGNALGCGAYLSNLCRTRIGPYLLKDAMSIELVEREIKSMQET